MHTTLGALPRIPIDPLTTRVFELGLSTRTLYRVARMHARKRRLDDRVAVLQMTATELARYTADDLLEERGFGIRALAEVQERLARCGLELAPGPYLTAGFALRPSGGRA